MIYIDPDVMLWGFATGLFLGVTSSLIGFFIKSAFRWMGF